MNYIALAVLALTILGLVYMVFDTKGQGYVGDNLSAVHVSNHDLHDRSQEVYREEQLVPDTYNVPRSQPLLGVSFGRAPCVKCDRSNGDCFWAMPGQTRSRKSMI